MMISGFQKRAENKLIIFLKFKVEIKKIIFSRFFKLESEKKSGTYF